MKTFKKSVIAFFALLTIFSPTWILPTLAAPPHAFGASPTAQAIHIEQPVMVQSAPIHLADGTTLTPTTTANTSGTADISNNYGIATGTRIGTLKVERMGVTVRIFEGENLANMDKGAGRFGFSGFNFGNTVLAGHNRGSAGYFGFVRNLNIGDIITLELGGNSRTYAVSHEIFIEETDFSPLMDFGDNRLTLVTCLEYVRNQRRVVVAVEVY
ncbi:MAG: sortase [Turicibacter sp.]|nr:sortase [Turicibacter sp.]